MGSSHLEERFGGSMRDLEAPREIHACLWLEEFEFASKGFKVENKNMYPVPQV